jgi:phosphohistidine phosphatase
MKRIVLVRHAKSSWKNSDISDHDRPLNKRGERDAPFMASIFRKKKLDIDVIYSSTALRANSTAMEFAAALDFKKSKVIVERKLYLAETSDLLDFVRAIENNFNSIMIFGHNPGITSFACQLADTDIDNIPTCGIAVVEFEVNSWNEIYYRTGSLLFFEYPKKYFKDSDD